ncbi:MAG: hypothetical protein PHQ19_09325, partial [Candidatus Krumholzibacteria bacterium]|nr:hypothetical protein [Candidatus Krumholzibacteria bacterium]
MRTNLVIVACLFTLSVLAGCSEDDCPPCIPPVSEKPLGQMDIGIGGGTSGTVGTTLRICFVSSSSDTLFDMQITSSDDGTARMVDAELYPNFAAAADRLSDDVNDLWMIDVLYVPGGAAGGAGNYEATWLNGGFTGEYDPDLHGAEITRI